MKKIFLLDEYILNIALVIAVLSTLLSLYFSEILHYVPCVLCWYQRIFMYPLIVILLVGKIRQIKDIALIVLPLSLLGMVIAIYHNLIYYKIIPETISPCTLTAPCTQQQLLLFGFFTIPLGSLLAFGVINLLMIYKIKIDKTKIIKNTNKSKSK